jgi:hypothetical protein
MNCWTSLTVVGCGHFAMASVLPDSTLTPSAEITWPRNSTCSRNSAHLLSFMYNLFYFNSWKTCLRISMCSSFVLVYINMSSRYTKTPLSNSVKNT